MPKGVPKNGKNFGRPAGIPNKKSLELAELIELECPGFNPVAAMAKIAHFGVMATQRINPDGSRVWEDVPVGQDIRTKCLTEVAQYTAAKRKAIEHSGSIQQTGGVLLVDKIADPVAWLAATNTAILSTT